MNRSLFPFTLGMLATTAMILGAFAQTPARPRPTIDFARQVRPILADKCFACHGPDDKHRLAGFRLDQRSGAVAKGASGFPVIVPGKPEKSGLIQRAHATGALQMPPASTGKRLSVEDKRTLSNWIAQGAPYAEHWAFVRPTKRALPKVILPTRNPIDNFVVTDVLKAGLKPSPEADRYTLVRRLSLDILGMPPTPSEVDAFVQDGSRDAYDKLVDRLLASPHFGEKWARHWLDLARFADSAGYGSDPLRPHIWPYRDWVINALNRNMPYDEFTRQQLAGDLLPTATREQIVATAFHRNTMTNTEGGTDREEFRTAAVRDRTNTTVQVWMGLTMSCAQCHTHKYDPISQKDYYRFMAFFNQTEDNDRPDEHPILPLYSPAQIERQERLKAEVAELKTKPGKESDLKSREQELAAIKPTPLPIMKELPADRQRKTHVLTLSNFLQKAEPVEAGTLTTFHALPDSAPKNRLGVAEWLLSQDNPLTARVAANRIWAQLFGKGIVTTEEDFGHQGALPTHPALLDWLAVDFMENGWDVKRLIKQIVTSGTYRQSSVVNATHLKLDPSNRLLARYPRRRLDAETVRDQALALSGMLSRKIGGPSVFPPQPPGMWQAAFNGERTWQTSTGEDRYRRGLYTFWRRTVPYPSMATFDAPSREICTVRRIPTNTPLQALVTLNDPAYLEMAQGLARRIVKEGGSSPDSQIRFALRLVTARPVVEAQAAALKSLYLAEREAFQRRPEDARKLATDPQVKLPEGVDLAELAAWTVLANVLLNMDSVMTNG